MRIALISDIHGNDVALHAALDDIRHVGADQIICLGDVATLGPSPISVIATLRQIQCPCILGNHDSFLLDPMLIHSYTDVPSIVEAVRWCHHQLSPEDFAWLRTFQPIMDLKLDADCKMLLFHGSPRSNVENLLATTAVDEVDRLLAGYHAPVMVGGHTHIQMLRQHHGMLLINAGSVGLPFKEFSPDQPPTILPHAEYALIDVVQGIMSVTFRRLPLDRAVMHAAVAASTTPLRAMLLQQYAETGYTGGEEQRPS